jgi:hypothetical protein
MEKAQEKEEVGCATKGCGEPGRWTPRIYLYPEGEPNYDEPVEMQFTGVAFCDRHFFGCTTDTLITDESWERLLQTFVDNDSILPARDTMKLKFECLQPPDRVH